MRRVALFLFSLILLNSCGSSRSTKIVTKKKKEEVSYTHNSKASKIINEAKKYNGVRYKYGGADKRGMDCSGLVTTAFNAQKITLPRTTKELSVTGDWIDLKLVEEGDLLFFATRKNSRKINHVGIVTNVNKKEVEFIHSTTSKGVITSLLSERYWYLAFVQARRIL